jgi:hypothetical protein
VRWEEKRSGEVRREVVRWGEKRSGEVRSGEVRWGEKRREQETKQNRENIKNKIKIG